jgi:predicted ATPase/KaiC/GvpD/RAD55 family RecA-like ATPase
LICRYGGVFLASLERDRVPLARPIPVKEVPLVDRTEEMNVLKEALYGTVHGEGGLVFVHGEAGIGKTRLLRELGAYAQSRGVKVLYGRCPALFRMDGVPPYILWKEVVKDYLETCTSEQLYRVIGSYPAEVAKLVPELSQKLRTIPQSFPIGAEHGRDRLFEAVSQFITNISREAPLLVVLDDLQWTDPSSLLLLHYLARGVQKTSLLLLGAYRSTDIDDKHPLTPVLTELNRERLPQEIPLKRMSLSDVSEMIKNILEQENVPEEFCKLVYEKTRGNPFFAEEVVKSLKEEGVIYREEEKWKFKEVSAIEFPKSVKNIVKARFSRLDDEYQNVLTFASFIGNDFTLEAMCALTGIEENKLLEIMDGLLKAGFIKHTVVRGEDICSFADIIVRDVVYEEVGPFKRKKLHGVVGSALEKVYAKTVDEHLGELASHFLESGDKEKALDYFMKAGEKAAGTYANAEAALYFQSALRLLEEKEGELPERGRILEHLGDIKRLVGEYEACMKYWNEALLLWTKLQEKEKAATLHRKMANVLWNMIGDKEKAKEHHKAALKILEAEPESVELARLYEDVGHMLRRMGQMTEALTWVEKALRLAEKLNALEVVASSCIELSVQVGWLGDYKKSREYANRALKIALDNDYSETALLAYDKAGGALPIEEYEKRLDCWEKALALAKKLGDISQYAYYLSAVAGEYMWRGELDQATTLGEEALALARRAGDMTYIPWYLLLLGEAYQKLGEWDKSEQYYKEAMDISRNQNEAVTSAWSRLELGLLHIDKGEYAKAKELLEEAFQILGKAGAKTVQMVYSQFLIWTSIEFGETEKAQGLLDSLQNFALETEDKGLITGEVALRAMLLRAQKKYAESIELFEKTLKEWESIKANIWNAYYFARWVLCEYARVYLERNEEGDREKADKLLNQALEMFQKMGAKKDIEKVEARIAFTETGKVVSKPKPEEHVSTGYADLDKLLYGGIPPNCAVVLTSPSCNERDLLVKSFLETGVKNGEATFYITIDASAARTLAEGSMPNLHLFVCNPEADAIVKSAPNVFTLKGVENLTDISIALTSAIRKLDPSLKGPRRICIGLVSDVLLYHHAVETRRWLSALMTKLKSEDFTTLAVMDPEMHSPQDARAILDLFDGEINIFKKEAEKGAGKYLRIQKMSNHEYQENEVLMKKEQF